MNNCAADVPVMNDNTVARTLSNPTITGASITSLAQVGANTNLLGSGSNIIRQEWAFPNDNTSGARPGAVDNTPGATQLATTVRYNNTNARAVQYRIQGSGGEARTSVTVTPSPLVVTLIARGGQGGTGGNGYNSGTWIGGAGGAAGDVAQGTFHVTSLPFTFDVTGFGTSGDGPANSGTNVGGGSGEVGGSGGGGTAGCRTTTSGFRVCWQYGNGGGGGSGFSASIWASGTLLLRGRGGDGGQGGIYSTGYAVGYGGSTSNTTTSGGGVFNFSSSASNWQRNSSTQIQAPAVAYDQSFTSNASPTIPAGA